MTNKKVNNQAIDSSERVDVDNYDRGIIPAETVARKKREGENYKTLPTEQTQEDASTNDQSNADSINTTDGYTIDQEGLVNNYAVEPEMYYETPGDARKQAIQDSAERVEELQEINQDQEGKLTEKRDTRGKGPGRI
ncbi:hypothetical protein [Nodularia spumigena]|jgi:hypothetical protein|uniref:Uncharacterized protein n=1 Tax=Nodularia spumigena UHCC 0060 TaxID=3110300 RepID=A0ABU5ULR4_NODSP|nr:hypothetical protein [Nodularia spumigena]MEA5525838.1 hypothetical protein [Nodularia spumigena UHCC 0143]MEA5556231.1 hypothetical protein [Nodularia spumigena CH309]MEA5606942.1 hypothetical protein [Nodularia spumigena UHCC 0060]MEA5614437.1 hypothetical protein [Nodularia spumigena UHCC 0040]